MLRDLVIIGGGPVGLAAAIAARQRGLGLRARVVERAQHRLQGRGQLGDLVVGDRPG